MKTYLFTSESVDEGHFDKLCDQISDAILDACLEQDPESQVACRTSIEKNKVIVSGEMTTNARVDYIKIVRDTCRKIGYVSDNVGLDTEKCPPLVGIKVKRPEIARAIHGPEEVGSEQGHVFGYATDETPEFMPLSHVLATKLGARLTDVRKDGTCPWLRPIARTQVTLEYYDENGVMVPVRVHTVFISIRHDGNISDDQMSAALKEHVIKPVIPKEYLDDQTIFHIEPTFRFVIGDRAPHEGATGLKISTDYYGGWGANGGDAFSGKDPTKVTRGGAYIARQAAKSVVAVGLARRCLVQLSYATGMTEPLSVSVSTYGTGKIPDTEILDIVKGHFDFRPEMIAIDLDLKWSSNGRYLKTAVNGHFGRDDPDFTWETVKHLNW